MCLEKIRRFMKKKYGKEYLISDVEYIYELLMEMRIHKYTMSSQRNHYLNVVQR